MGLPVVRLMPLASGSSREVIMGSLASVQPYGVGDLCTGDEEMADFQLADLPAGSYFCPSLRYDATKCPLLGEWHMVGAIM